MSIDRHNIVAIMHLLQLSDTALPVGAFSFSSTLESASDAGVVHNDESLEAYTRQIVRIAALTDGVAALIAWRAIANSDYSMIITADKALFCSKLNNEARQMSQRMGRKLTELMTPLLQHNTLTRWHDDIMGQKVTGTYAVTQAIVAKACDIEARELFCSICYGAASIILSAALRCTRTTHLATQGILFRMAKFIEPLYEEAAVMTLDEMNSFSPQCDIMAALHEKGSKRLFMN